MQSPRAGSVSTAPASVFDPVEEEAPEDYHTEPTTAPNSGSGDEREHYDLKAPPPSVPLSNMEALAIRFFSVDHLNVILRDHQLASRFNRFVNQYKPYALPSLESYLDTQKAAAAIEYANALANNLPSLSGDVPRPAAVLDETFQDRSLLVVQELVDDALPAYLTHRLVQVVTDTLVKEITGNNAPIMRDMIPALAEVYCVTDPSLPDNPIVYASEGMSTGSHDIGSRTDRSRILQHKLLWKRLRDWAELSLLAGTKDVGSQRVPSDRGLAGRSRADRDDSELVSAKSIPRDAGL